MYVPAYVYVGLAHACAYLKYPAFICLMTFVSICSYYTATLLIACQTSTQSTYSEVAQDIMGKKFALYIVRPFQFLLFFCLLPVFIVLGAEGMQEIDGLRVGNNLLPQKMWSIVVSK